MNRRHFLQSSAAVAASSAMPSVFGSGSDSKVVSMNRASAKIAAYYFRAHMYTCVPRHIREDMEWMAEKGTNYVCPAVLEQDLFAARENLDLITTEAERVGMRILAVPSRWGGLVAGAPKVPSMFSVLNPQTWIQLKDGRTGFADGVSGVISSIHSPETFEFFCETMRRMYVQHPSWAGLILDEPKAFMMDYSPPARKALGGEAAAADHLRAVRDFFSRVCAYAKTNWPDKCTILFQQAYLDAQELEISSEVEHLDFYGLDGRPWGYEDDNRMKGSDGHQESGKGKVLLGGVAEKVIEMARKQDGRKSFVLIENHNLKSSMIEPLDRNFPAVLALPADMFCYYYYPRNVEEPDRVMDLIGRHLRKFTRG